MRGYAVGLARVHVGRIVSAPDILPTSRAGAARATVNVGGVEYEACFCMNCGKHDGYTPLVDREPIPGVTYTGWLCVGCAEKWAPLAGTMITPTQAINLRIGDAMLEDYGRILAPVEQHAELHDVNSPLSRLARSLG